MIAVTYAPGSGAGLYGLALAAIQPPKPDVRFNVARIGETEIHTVDGFKVTIRVLVKSLKRAGTDKGVAMYDMEFEVTPTVAPLLQAHQQDSERAN